MNDRLMAERLAAMPVGMGLAVTARHFGERPAVTSEAGKLTFGELNARANQVARLYREKKLQPEDAVGLLCSNRPEFAEVTYGGSRSGLRTTPINWHLKADEIAYILGDCEAKVFVAEDRFSDVAIKAASKVSGIEVKLAIGGPIEGFAPYDEVAGAQREDDVEDPVLGRTMLYTSGTTGRPKGVYRPPGGGGIGGAAITAQWLEVLGMFGHLPEEDLHLITGPLYHSAPLVWGLAVPMALGVGVVMMNGWDPEETLRLIERHRITHTHLVPTMFHRLVALPEDVRSKYDVSSLRFILHGAAPCPVPVKKAIIDWFGPVVWEYYAATEGLGTFVSSEEWLTRPGTVGKPAENEVEVRRADGGPAETGEVGLVYLKAGENLRFEYFKDPEGTTSVYQGDYYTLGDMGYVDEDGYLFLTDRTADLIISGGVNIYPAEVDGVFFTHPAVADVATIGVPSDEWGEEVKSVVLLKDGLQSGPELERELIEFCRERLAHYKCPKSVDFVDSLPRSETGKIYRRLVREPYWQGRESKI